MCGIAGFYNPHRNYSEEETRYSTILKELASSLNHRGTDDSGTFLTEHAGLSHGLLSVNEPEENRQPTTKEIAGNFFAALLNGELYNAKELKTELKQLGYSFPTGSDTEILLNGFIEYGPDFVKKLNGVFAAAFYDAVKPVSYTHLSR